MTKLVTVLGSEKGDRETEQIDGEAINSGRIGEKDRDGGGGEARADLLVGAGEALADDLALEGAALVEGEVLVVLRQPRLALLVHEQHEPDRHLRRFPFLLRGSALQPPDSVFSF